VKFIANSDRQELNDALQQQQLQWSSGNRVTSQAIDIIIVIIVTILNIRCFSWCSPIYRSCVSGPVFSAFAVKQRYISLRWWRVTTLSE